MQRVLIITNIHDNFRSEQSVCLQRFVDEINKQSDKVQAAYCSVQELLFSVQNGHCGIKLDDKELKDEFDVINLRNAHKFTDYANALRLYCEEYNLELINAEGDNYPYSGKVSQGFIFAINDIPTPSFISSPSNVTLLRNAPKIFSSMPIIVKHNEGIKGNHNYLVESLTELEEKLGGDKKGFLIQSFVKNDGELRVLTFGDGQPLIFRKVAVEGSHLNNTSQGGNAERLEPGQVKPEILQTALRAAEVTKREIAGVDVLLASDGAWYILEVNHTPAIASGVFLGEKRDHYIRFVLSLNIKKEEV